MSSSLTTPVDFYLLLLPAIFGFVFAFVVGLGVYQYATLCHVKKTYERRNRVLASRLAHSLNYCEAHSVTSVYDTLREWNYNDLYDSAGGKSSQSHTSKDRQHHSSRRDQESSSGDSASAHNRQGGRAGAASQSWRRSEAGNGHLTSSSFMLDEVTVLDSDDESSSDS